jgi:hypothetical protein
MLHLQSGSRFFFDPGTGNWKKRWFLDGEVGQVRNGPDGIKLTAGPEFRNDAHHMVLWTRDQFSGDLKIEFEYTRLDDETLDARQFPVRLLLYWNGW